jgi:hypothetical protein
MEAGNRANEINQNIKEMPSIGISIIHVLWSCQPLLLLTYFTSSINSTIDTKTFICFAFTA